MEIRPASREDIPEIAELWSEAFSGRRTVQDRARVLEVGGRYGGLETVIVARDSAGLAGALKVYRLEQYLAGVAFPMMGLAAVAVEPSRRRRGLGARLCLEAIRVAVERGDEVSVLYPFRPDYYGRLGWGLVGGLLEYRFRTESLPLYHEAAAARPATDADRDAIAECYARVAARSNGPIARDRRIWDYRIADQDLGVQPVDPPGIPDDARRRVMVHDDRGVTGYAFLRFTAPRAPGDRRVDVTELVAEDETAYRGLVGAIGDLDERWPLARHFARPEERFGDRLRDPRPPNHRALRSLYFPTARIARGPMLRVLDAPAALRRRHWFDAGGHAGPFRVRIRDDQRPENEGPWTVVPGEEGAVVERYEEGGRDGPRARALLETDAATFARLFAGELPPTTAARLGRAVIEGSEHLLDRAFETRERFWLLDEF